MADYPSVLKIKEATLSLIQTVPWNKISVEMIRHTANISRNTFYKYFQNISMVWHTISHDLIHSLEMQCDTLFLTPVSKPIYPKRENIIRITALSNTSSADYFSAFLIKHASIIRCLTDGADPIFLEKWKSLSCSIFMETLRQHGYSNDRSRRIAEPLGHGLVDRCMMGIHRNDKQAIADSYLALGDILYLLCQRSGYLSVTKSVFL